jgi:uncharacterized lipoprotein YddW (UPF0748 family)
MRHAALVTAILCIFAASAALAASPNLLTNPGFEQVADGQPVAWETPTPEHLGATDGAIDTDVAHSGDSSLRLVRESAEDWGFWSQGPIDVEGGEVYDLGGWIRMEDVVRASYPGVFVLAHVLDAQGEVIQKGQTPYLGGTEDWEEWTATFTMHEDAAQVMVYLEHSRTTGAAWFDDVYLRRSDAEPLANDPGEMPTRAIWVSKSDFATPEAADAFIARAKSCNINVLLPNVYGHGSVMYQTDEFPMSGSVPEGFDPLGYLIERAHAEGMEVHPWFNVCRGPLKHLDEDRLWMFYWSAQRDRWFGGWADVHRPQFRDWIVSFMLDCVRRYDVDGLHYDYIRAGVDCACKQCAAEFEEQFGHGMDEATNTEWARWHTPAITDIVRRTTLGLREIRPDAITSAAVQTHHAGPRGGQDGPGWVREGILDVLMPMDYHTNPTLVEVNERNWIDQLGGAEHLVTGLQFYDRYTDDEGNRRVRPRTAEGVQKQVVLCGRLGIPGATIFASRYLSEEIAAALADRPWGQPATPHFRREGWRKWEAAQ